ncbi:MAG: hypothetical protein O7A67_09345 [SAR324 cluster bacterium]|nr:hypothetical protein [SAR324 cluster bacterium]
MSVQSAIRAGTRRLAIVLPAAALLICTGGAATEAQQENLLDRISNERMIAFERRLEDDIGKALRRYLAPGQYVLSVRVIWNRNVIPPTVGPGLAQDKYKLPGFPIFVRSPGAPVDEKIPPFTRLVVKMLIDETLPEYYERFLRKIVPIVARFVPDRGDQLIILKETFPELQREALLPPLSEEELMRAVGEPLPPSAPPPLRAPAPRLSAVEEARLAYDEGRYDEALRVVRTAFQQSQNNRERAQYLGMEGSIHYTMNDTRRAQLAWQRALGYNPSNPEVQRVLEFLQGREAAPQ